MFWRWAGVDPTVVLSGTDFNEAATIGERTSPSPSDLKLD